MVTTILSIYNETNKLTNSQTPGTFKHSNKLSDATLEREEEVLEGDEFLAFIRTSPSSEICCNGGPRIERPPQSC